MPSPNEMTAHQLARLIGTPDCPVLLDVCIDEDFDLDRYLIPGSRRADHQSVESLASSLLGERAVVICQKGKKLSQGVAAVLRHNGVSAEYLNGGMIGWREADLPRLRFDALPSGDAKGRSVWVTRHRPKIDRIACPWLIRRFVDPNAVFLFVAPAEVEAVAERFAATPFDIPDTRWSHRGGACTFETMLEEFELKTEPLDHLGKIIRAADSDHHDLAPQAAGLLAISLGLSRMFRDDLAQLEAGMTIYDALYRWSRDATDEKHDWQTHGGSSK